MGYVVRVQVSDGAEYRRDNPRGLFFRIGIPGIQVTAAAVFHHDEDLILVVVRFDRPNDVRMIERLQNIDFVLQLLDEGLVGHAVQVDRFHGVFVVEARSARRRKGVFARVHSGAFGEEAGSLTLELLPRRFGFRERGRGGRARGHSRGFAVLRKPEPGLDRQKGVLSAAPRLVLSLRMIRGTFRDAQFVLHAQPKEPADSERQLKAFLPAFVSPDGLPDALPRRSTGRLASFLNEGHGSHRSGADRLENLVVKQRVPFVLLVHQAGPEGRGQQDLLALRTFHLVDREILAFDGSGGGTRNGTAAYGWYRTVDSEARDIWCAKERGLVFDAFLFQQIG
mmetsp:Transcript_16016/g.37109  ORF Transcript_16016/g.37109 Transcript_16016/m.37109 type:complete len:338 (+) Transcript_16016:1633-2646(+)